MPWATVSRLPPCFSRVRHEDFCCELPFPRTSATLQEPHRFTSIGGVVIIILWVPYALTAASAIKATLLFCSQINPCGSLASPGWASE